MVYHGPGVHCLGVQDKGQILLCLVGELLIVFDWMGHKCNRAKLAFYVPVQWAYKAKCWQCSLIDSQQKLLEFKHAPLITI
jgi:hypothetical protein